MEEWVGRASFKRWLKTAKKEECVSHGCDHRVKKPNMSARETHLLDNRMTHKPPTNVDNGSQPDRNDGRTNNPQNVTIDGRAIQPTGPWTNAQPMQRGNRATQSWNESANTPSSSGLSSSSSSQSLMLRRIRDDRKVAHHQRLGGSHCRRRRGRGFG